MDTISWITFYRFQFLDFEIMISAFGVWLLNHALPLRRSLLALCGDHQAFCRSRTARMHHAFRKNQIVQLSVLRAKLESSMLYLHRSVLCPGRRHVDFAAWFSNSDFSPMTCHRGHLLSSKERKDSLIAHCHGRVLESCTFLY